jgi:hypothetical protein
MIFLGSTVMQKHALPIMNALQELVLTYYALLVIITNKDKNAITNLVPLIMIANQQLASMGNVKCVTLQPLFVMELLAHLTVLVLLKLVMEEFV